MGLLGAAGLSLVLVSLTQIPKSAEGCTISSALASGPSSILVKWEAFPQATSYILDLRVVNNSNIAPVVVNQVVPGTEKDVQGLRPGTNYNVTLKVFQYVFTLVCTATTTAWTVPDTSQIELGQALSSTSILVKWTPVALTQRYYLLVISQTTGQTLNITYANTNLSALVEHLQPNTNYDCYVFTANQGGLGIRSKVRTVMTLVLPPVNVTATQTSRNTARVTWQPVKDVLLYRASVQNLDDPTSKASVQNVSETKADFQNIFPCSTYRISVSSFNKFLVPSEPTVYTYTTNNLSPVTSISANYFCANKSALVSWLPVFGADSYNATVQSRSGTRRTCSSQGTSCQVSALSCGEYYVVYVTPVSGNCRNTLNTTSATFQTAPCAPKNLALLRNCPSDVIMFSWEHTNNTDYYKATAVDSTGVVHECITVDNVCNFTQSVCGQNYFFTVSAVTGLCQSEVSATVNTSTAPCIPTNVHTSNDCTYNNRLITWDLAEGALWYTVEAFGNRGNHSSYSCTTFTNSCALQDVLCGEYLTIYVTAFDNYCRSPQTLAPATETAPCTPQNVVAVKECSADAVTVTWDLSSGAIFYMVMVKESSGATYICNSMDLTCKVQGLQCGTNYTVSVIASNFACNSSGSQSVAIVTAACPPSHVAASLNCDTNEALISWLGSPSLNSYTATIVDENQGLLSCNSATTSCSVPSLLCGKLYKLTVCYHDGTCPCVSSTPVYFDSVPCGPANVQARVDCASGGLSIGWDATRNAEGYITVISSNGTKSSYNTTQPALSVSTLQCGLDYTVKVASFNRSCSSLPSVVSVRETPCVPTNVVVKRNCSQSLMDLTWQTSLGAKNYTAVAVGKDGSRVVCGSNTTGCRMDGLVCSQLYNVSVSAADDACSSAGSPVVQQATVPCPPSQLSVSLNCSTNAAVLTWNSSPNAASYSGRAVSSDGHTVTCGAGASLSCQLQGLQCDRDYSFTVSASDGDCQSPDSKPVVQTTAPCPVQNVLNTLNCNTNALMVSWAPRSRPLNYSVRALARGGAELLCSTPDSNCTLTTLKCGEQYNVTVKAASSACDGPSSAVDVVTSVPCVPVNVQGSVDCVSNALQSSWDAAAGATSYLSAVWRPGAVASTCVTADQRCVFPGLQCAQTYMFNVVALSSRCNSSGSVTGSARTAPCDPKNVTAALSCLSGVATVTWGASAGAQYYTVLAEASGLLDSCYSTSTSCQLSQLQCGQVYAVTVLAGDGRCNSSILARTNVTTAPCAPVIRNYNLDCSSNRALVTWVEDKYAMSVTVNATSSLGHSTSCISSTNGSCVLVDLRCGSTYTVQAAAQGAQCVSKPSSTFKIVTAPCTPAHVDAAYSCVTGITVLTWDETLGRKSFYAVVQSGNSTASCRTNQTDCSFPSLLCGRTYDVKVMAVADQCNSSVPGVAQIQTGPCPPTSVKASLLCDNNTAAVSWQPGLGAVYYQVTALGRNGDSKVCSTGNSSCLLRDMVCSETYVITVSPFSLSCKGTDSSPYNYLAGSCPPTNVQVSLQCVGNVAHVTWTAASLADFYVVTAVSAHEHNCTSPTTTCDLTGLSCGETAVVTVVTVERGCRSRRSAPVTFQSVICPPTDVFAVTNCQTSDITVQWSPSPRTGVSYFLYSQEYSGATANYSTSQTSYVITELQCSRLFTFTVAARDSLCTSDLSLPAISETAPCPPTNLSAIAECGTNLATLTWVPSVFATSYTATATGNRGQVASCSSHTTTCSMKLNCGDQFSAAVVASSATCNSSAGANLSFPSAPCLPDKVLADVECSANAFAVQWRAGLGSTVSYTAIAIANNDTQSTCNSTGTNCTISNLRCGLTYSIVVTTSKIKCGTIEGSDYKVQSAPCQPNSVLVNLHCSTNVASVTWGNSGPDQTEVVTAVDSRGLISTCNSSSSNCIFDRLSCGESYTISVEGHTNSCSSAAAVAQSFKTAPCVPNHLTATVDCDTGITTVSWDAARGATSYTAYARGSLGNKAECNTTDTTCDFPNLSCGQDYNITVVARHDSCVSLVSESITATTEPCPQSNLKTTLDCSSNTAVVSWTPGRGILYYNASADALSGAQPRTCSTNGSSCNISSLGCGGSYRVSVSGQGQNCPSPAEEWNRINSAPCPPTHVKVISSCTSNNITVSWGASQGSVSYVAVAEDAQGQQWSCTTGSTSCEIPDLSCGGQYQVYVFGVDDKCNGARSNAEVIHTAPCVPYDIQNNLDCLSGVLNVSWQSTGYFVQFRTSVVSSKGDVSICTTDKHQCVIQNLQCGLRYNVSVMAGDAACNSSQSPTKQVLTAPCPPSSFLTSLNCDTGVVSVSWNSSEVGVVYVVTAVDSSGRRHTCNGTAVGCSLSTLECGSEYEVSVTPFRSGCVGRSSPTAVIKTVPCVPTLSTVEIDCLANSAWLFYEESAGAEDYVAIVTDTSGGIQALECNSTTNGICTLPEQSCSQNLTLTLKARNKQCSSGPSNALTTETAPCPPQNIENAVDCDSHAVRVGWSSVPGAVKYTATLEQISGGTTCCSSSATGCNVTNLPCGEMYILLVTAEGRTCNSTQSNEQIVRTTPCVPQNLKGNLSCTDNVASVSWNQSRGGQLYRAKAVSADGHEEQCVSHDSQCELKGLRCGRRYTVQVTAEDIDCISQPSDSIQVKTVPCTPAAVSSVVNCEANSLNVSWSQSSGADSYLATLQDSSGYTTTCQATTQGWCNVTGLGCGQIYHVSVVSSDGYCNSSSTPVVTTPSVPCKARHLKAAFDCDMKVAVVSWYPGDGAVSYVVTLSSALGPDVTCQTNDTHCDVKGLLCGQNYSVSVKAMSQSCSSIAYLQETLVTGPCIPVHVTTKYSLSIGQVVWDMAAGATYYTVKGTTEQGSTSMCATNDTYCALYNLECGQLYSTKVTSNNQVCQGADTSNETVIITEPCPPNNVETSVRCEKQAGTVSWEPSVGAVGYRVSLAGRNGHALSCSTNETFCSIEGLDCGVLYYTTVVAIGDALNSTPSTFVSLFSAPCAAADVAAKLNCDNSTAEVSWSAAVGAVSYLVTAVATDGDVASCESVGLQCELSGLHCGQTYNVSLTASDNLCSTEIQTNVSFKTAPCVPLRAGVDLLCGTSAATLFWEEAEGVELYLATAVSSLGATMQCNSTNSTCKFSSLQCGETYEFSVSAYSNGCYSKKSSTVAIKTEPCQPTGLIVQGSCYSQTVALAWTVAKGALLYEVTASGNLGYVQSFQTNTTTLQTELLCGQLFIFTVKAQDEKCDSALSLPRSFKTAPCVPENVQAFTRCENSLGSVSWAKSNGADSYIAVAKGLDDHVHMCTTNTTTCTWSDLHCSGIYTVNVIANDQLCSSLPSNSTSIRMAPCIPQNVKSSMNCTLKVASLTWNSSKTAEFYLVTAENTNKSHKVQLSTNDTWTFISEFQCGQDYFLSVQAVDSVCTSLPSIPIKQTSVPCPPTRASSMMNCVSNIALVSWNISAGALFYMATLTQGGGPSRSCWSDSNQCGVPKVPCGTNFTVSVVASNNQCYSDPTKGNTFTSVPCVPVDVNVKMDCSRNQAVVSWNVSDGALWYKVTAQNTQGANSSCETTDIKCTLTNLTCGQTYSVQVVAQDNICSSWPSPALIFNSVPCKPNIGSAVIDCFTNSALLNWSYADGALYYTSTARSSNGHVSTCNSTYTNCELENLQCGQTYNVIVVASNENCNSAPSNRIQVDSVPCPPQNVVPTLDCSTNRARVAWQAGSGADSYIVQAFGEREHESVCKTSSQSCDLTDLICGFKYNISVVSINSVCNVSESEIQQLEAVPCVPQQVEAWVNCESGAVAVSWEPSAGSVSYTTVAHGSGGYESTCNSTNTTCQFYNLLCSLNYSITVRGSDMTCSSAGSSAVTISTLPCVPQKVTAQMECSNDTGLVSWEKEEGVVSYAVQASGPDGHKMNCSSADASCQLPNLHCGQLYNLSVNAKDARCDNSLAYLTLQSAPCRPTNVKASLQCQSNSAAVTWEQASGAVSYYAVGATADGSHRTVCNNTLTHCYLSDLECSQTYNVSVYAEDELCSSVQSDKSYVQTAPCAPQNVTALSECSKGAITVSWAPVRDAQYFHAAAVSNTGARLHCNSSSTSCTLNSLPCGQSYNITVLAVRDGCESRPSDMVQTSSVPCVPRNVTGRLDCISNSVWVTGWDDAPGALSYFVFAQGAKGHNSSCSTSSDTCKVPDLKCGARYTFRVTAINNFCTSNDSTTFDLETGPCALSAVSAVTQCNSSSILVQWENTVDSPFYLVTAEGQDQTLISCNSSSSSCELQGTRCGMQYSIIVSSSSNKCSSLRSPPTNIKTAPCVPDQVTVEQICEGNGATVRWSSSYVATSYLLTATGRDGHVASCNTSVNNCTLTALHCGQPYSISITASGDNCTSKPRTSSLTTVPCEPSGLSVSTNCHTNSAFLSWNAVEGAVQYYSQAQSIDGSVLHCEGSVSSCTFKDLRCGDIFNFSVQATNSICNTSSSPLLTAGAVPCPPAAVYVRMQKMQQAYWTRTTWDSVNCSNVEYLVEISGRIKNNPQTLVEVSSYWLPRRYFEIPLPCSTAFNLTVRSRNSAGVGEPSSPIAGITAPCPPENVKYSGNTQSAVLSWDGSVFATSYTVYNVSGTGRTVLCNTTSLFCQLANFNASAIEMTASNAVGESNSNRNITGPIGARSRRDLWAHEVFSHPSEDLRTPEVLTVTVSGVRLYVKWATVKYATEYKLIIEEENQQIVRTIQQNNHTETDLKPWTKYCIKLAAVSGLNQSSYSRPVCRTTGAS